MFDLIEIATEETAQLKKKRSKVKVKFRDTCKNEVLRDSFVERSYLNQIDRIA